MTMPARGLLLTFLFSGLALGSGVVGRWGIDAAQVNGLSETGGSSGMLLWILAPALLALVFRRLDPATRQRRFFALRGARHTRRAALAVGLLAGAAVAALIATGMVFGGLAWAPKPMPAAQLLVASLSIALFAILEESAWRGYLLPSLLARLRYRSVLGLGALVWFGWHLPYLEVLTQAYTVEPLSTLAPRLLLGVLAMQFLYMELFLRWPSVWPAFALHAGMNICAQAAFASGLSQSSAQPWLFSPSADGVLVILLCAGLGAWLRRARQR
ncbi:CPBP family intramembrane glutamic endopeptidase [Paucibacter sp. AS339]|uniref:CPBP family intramembrane glutamic endopeptidase n=1 Tax=Paucibacter hankyongi TaxID=3133434 RepID=UPI0030AD509A